ncbi:hypothetical protein P7C71_g4921, partial [Lecanoromycetidae sp. Uapishka_2]
MTDEICGADISYKTAYGDYQSGGWHTAIMYAPDGENNDGLVHDGKASPTSLINRLPITKSFLEDLGLDYFTVRIARNDHDSWLWEHRDYVELDEEKKRLRLHVPLVSNPDAIMQFPQCKVHVAPGWIWKLDPTVSHAISNTGTATRMHLILDCYINKNLRHMLNNETLEEEHVQPLPLLNLEERTKLLAQAQELFVRQGSEKAEQYLLKTFHQFDLGAETSYELLIDFYRDMGFRSRENYWISEQNTRMYNRGKTNAGTPIVNMRGLLFSNPHASKSDLPQFSMFKQILQTCRLYPGLERVYVRGSLARGDADPFSDIDLLCIVAPEEFASFIKRIDTGLKERHSPLGEAWVDTIVKDFGGVGFVYLLQTDKGLYQLDLYVACRGHPSLDHLNRVPHKQEIFRHDRTEGDNRHSDTLHYRLHSDMVEQEIRRINSIEPSVSRTLTELNVLGFMIKKCLERGDEFVAGNEYNTWMNCFIKLVRHKFDKQHRDYGFYHVKRLMNEANDRGALYEDLRAMNNHPLNMDRFKQVHRYAMVFVQKHFPEIYTQQQNMIDSVTRHIEGYQVEPLIPRLNPCAHSTLGLLNLHGNKTEMEIPRACDLNI